LDLIKKNSFQIQFIALRKSWRLLCFWTCCLRNLVVLIVLEELVASIISAEEWRQ